MKKTIRLIEDDHPVIKKYTLSVIFIAVVTFAHAQVLDDLPFPNPDPMTFFQHEMTSLMRFQIENDTNVPFFVTLGQYRANFKYKESEVRAAVPGQAGTVRDGESHHINLLLGFQARINQYIYIPLFAYLGQSNFSDIGDRGVVLDGGYRIDNVFYVNDEYLVGAGLFLNLPVFKAGFYVWTGFPQVGMRSGTEESGYLESGYDPQVTKVAFLPIVDTSEMRFVGNFLKYIMGFIGMGDVLYFSEEEASSNAAGILGAMNVLLDLTFNRVDIDFLTLNSRAYYKRGNYDTASKTDRYGVEIGGLFSSYPLGFSLAGGYQHFYYSPYFASTYHDSAFFDETLYVDLKRFGRIGTTYRYDGVSGSKFIISYSNKFLAGFWGLSPSTKTDKTIDGHSVERRLEILNPYLGLRFRWDEDMGQRLEELLEW